MRIRGRARPALAGFLLLGSSATALVVAATGARAVDLPSTWSGFAQGSGFRVSVTKPAQLPTADEVAGLSVPFARAESDSSPSGRAIGSWLWPGETAAAAKSLLLVGLDPGAADAERQQRERENPGHGCDPERALKTPAVTSPSGDVIVDAQTIRSPITNEPLYDPTDNPCGEVAARRALQTAVNERLPEYPFWAHSVWPAASSSDEMDRRTICEAPSAFPPKYDVPAQAQRPCPDAAGMPRGGLIEAISNEGGNWGTAQVGSFLLPGVAKAGEITSVSRVEWIGNVLVSSASVTIKDLTLFGAGGAEFVRAASTTSTATIASDDRAPVARLEATGVTVALAGRTYDAAIERNRIRVADTSLPAGLQEQMTAALDALSRRISFGTCAASSECGGEDASLDADAANAAAGLDPATRTVRVAAIAISMTENNSVEGATNVRLSFGLAEASAITRFSPPYVPPKQPDAPGAQPDAVRPVIVAPVSAPGSGTIAAPRSRVGLVPVRGELPSEPIPIAVVLFAILGIVAGGGALVAAGLWETVL